VVVVVVVGSRAEEARERRRGCELWQRHACHLLSVQPKATKPERRGKEGRRRRGKGGGEKGEHLDERQLERRLSELALLWGDSKTGEAGPMGLLWP
jgi:hypothetical protein